MLTTLHSAREWCRYADVVEEEVFIELDGHVIPRIVTDRRPEYSEELRNLVRECLNPRIGSRPTASDLVTRTQAGMERYRTTLNGRNATRAPTLRHLTKSKSVLPEKRASRWHQPVSGVTASAPPPAPVLLATAVPTAPALGAGEGEGEREGEAAYQGAGEEPIAGLYRGAGAGGIAGADAVFSSSGETSDEPRRAGAGGVAGADAVFSSSGEIGDESLGPTWEPFSGAEKGRPSGSRASPIKSRSNRDVLPPKVPPHLKNGRGGKRRRDGTGGQSVSSKRSKSTNSAGEVIVISSDISSANAPATAAAPPPTPTADKDPDHSNVLQEDVVAPDVIVISSDTSASNAPPIDKTRANHNIARQANGNGGSSRSPSKPRSARDRSRSRVRKKSNRTGNSRDSSADEEGSDEQRYEEEDEDGADEEADSDGDRDDSSEAYEAKAKYDDSKDKTYNPYEDNQDEDSMEYKSRLRPRRRRQRRR